MRQSLPASIDVAVIGGGQAGLATSWHLTDRGRDHVVIDRGQIGDSWRNRWDAFHLVTPNWQLQLPGDEYRGDEPDAFLPRDEIVARIEAWAGRYGPPFEGGTDVDAVEAADGGFIVRTSRGEVRARRVIVAAGTYHRPKVPAGAGSPSGVVNLAATEYRNAASVVDGAVLVVGTGQSGVQIAEDLHRAGRTVHLAAGRAGRAPRRHRGADVMTWIQRAGLYDQPISEHPMGEMVRFRTHPHACGAHGGHSIDLRAFGRDGIRLHGHLVGIEGSRVRFADDLAPLLAAADESAATFQRLFDQVAERGGYPVTDEVDQPVAWDPPSGPLELDLAGEGITTVIWASGFDIDFGWVHAPIHGTRGYPIVDRGFTSVPGLAFVGLHWMHTWKSGLLYGVGSDAAYVVDRIG